MGVVSLDIGGSGHPWCFLRVGEIMNIKCLDGIKVNSLQV